MKRPFAAVLLVALGGAAHAECSDPDPCKRNSCLLKAARDAKSAGDRERARSLAMESIAASQECSRQTESRLDPVNPDFKCSTEAAGVASGVLHTVLAGKPAEHCVFEGKTKWAFKAVEAASGQVPNIKLVRGSYEAALTVKDLVKTVQITGKPFRALEALAVGAVSDKLHEFKEKVDKVNDHGFLISKRTFENYVSRASRPEDPPPLGCKGFRQDCIDKRDEARAEMEHARAGILRRIEKKENAGRDLTDFEKDFKRMGAPAE